MNTRFNIRAVFIFVFLCAVILVSAYIQPALLFLIAVVFLSGLLPLKSRMEGLYQEVVYMGFLAAAVSLPIGFFIFNYQGF